MEEFRAYRIDQTDGNITAGFCSLRIDDLAEGDVVIRVSHSTINYKDALAVVHARCALRIVRMPGSDIDEVVDALVHVRRQPRQIRYATVMRQIELLRLTIHDPIDRLVRFRRIEMHRGRGRVDEFSGRSIELAIRDAETVSGEDAP